jgi:hypothetical protein
MTGGKVVSNDEVDGVRVPHAAAIANTISRPTQNRLA